MKPRGIQDNTAIRPQQTSVFSRLSLDRLRSGGGDILVRPVTRLCAGLRGDLLECQPCQKTAELSLRLLEKRRPAAALRIFLTQSGISRDDFTLAYEEA
jgi:hypothetical protein